MSKESLIEQLGSQVAGACACLTLREAARKITRSYNSALQPAGIKVTQFTILTAAALGEGKTLTELAQHLGMDRTTFSRNLAPLEREGLVETFDDGHGRARSTRLTAKGVKVMEVALPLWKEAQTSFKAELGNDVWRQVQTGLAEVGRLA